MSTVKEAVHYLEYLKSRGVRSISKEVVVPKPEAKKTENTQVVPLMEGTLDFNNCNDDILRKILKIYDFDTYLQNLLLNP